VAVVFHLSVLTPERAWFSRPVVSLQAPGSQGYLGVLAHHAPLITDLVPGMLAIRDDSGVQSVYAVSGGFLEVSRNRATVLADAVEPVAEIDVERARRARDRAVERLRGPSKNRDVERAQAALARALNRLRAADGDRGRS